MAKNNNITIFQKLLSLAFMMSFFLMVYGSPLAPIPRTLSQADQSTFEAILWGDEFINGIEATNGFTIAFDDAEQNWKYAIHDTDGYLIPSSITFDPTNNTPEYQDGSVIPLHLRPTGEATNFPNHDAAYYAPNGDVLKRNIPSFGTGTIVVIPVNFNDTSTTFSPTSLNDVFFGSSTGSLKSYFEEVSYGNFTISGIVTNWVNASNAHDYYRFQSKYSELVEEAIISVDSIVNFSLYDQNSDCYVDTIAITHQGGDQGTYDIRSHRSSLDALAGSAGGGSYTTNDICIAEPSKMMIANDYIMGPELFGEGNEAVITNIGVYSHEYGHMLGLPDLYDTEDTNGSSAGIGLWGPMGWGMWNGTTNYIKALGNGDTPSHLTAWSKYHLGWVTPQLLTGPVNSYNIQAASEVADVYQVLLGSPSPTAIGEYFLIENRQLTKYDSELPGAGLAIWHIDESMSEYNNENQCYPPQNCSSTHYRVSLVQADGNWSLEQTLDLNNLGDKGDLYMSSSTGLSNTTIPSSNLYDGTETGITITDISPSGLSMQVNMGLSPGYVQFTSNSYSSYENSGNIPVYVSRTGGNAGTVSIDCNPAAGTATSGNDYVATTQTLSWANGETSRKICWVTALDDNYVEVNEFIQLNLSNPIGGVAIGDQSTATLTLEDNETCSGDEVILDDVDFQAGVTITCTATTSITANNSNIENGADVTFIAPHIYINNGFTGNPTFNARN